MLVDADYYSFFFQAEDGIRDRNVTGVQTCALPISLYKEKDAWVEEKLKWHLDLRMLKGSDFDSEVYKRGKEIDVMSKEAQKAYLAIFYEIQNVISQTHTY